MDHDSRRVTLYSVPGQCPLCDTAREVLKAVCPGFLEVDIRTDRSLLRAYRNEIPVVTVDGEKQFVGRVDPHELARMIETGPNIGASDA